VTTKTPKKQANKTVGLQQKTKKPNTSLHYLLFKRLIHYISVVPIKKLRSFQKLGS
jgi:hypothetical protein